MERTAIHSTFLLVALALGSRIVVAQSLVQADVLPAVGASWHMRALQALPPEIPLSHDMVWPYSDVVGNDLFGTTHTVLEPEPIAGSAVYADADRAVRTVPDNGSSTSFVFYDVKDHECLDLGTLGSATSTVYQPGALLHAYPLELGDQRTGSFCYTSTNVGGSAQFCGSSVVSLAATGTLELSFGTFHDVRLLTMRKAAAAAPDGTDSVITVVNDWYAPGIPYPLLHFTTYINAQGGITRSGQILDDAALVSLAEPLRERGMPVYPNPTTGILTVEHGGSGILLVQTVDGRVVRSLPQNTTERAEVDLGDLPAGAYTLRFHGKGEARTARVVVTH
ncbi:MAG: T9SS type A sorting domain-containing protein [Flavobacteriales bacterium]|nr:T9SS type A sorting domain-containing protein [Flavobacteriales bacterium]